ncbi:hypothetical protein RHMOL_Rhmol09G0125600 [Rhododendron molle]|uniref:Uncharacterized protein n=1 Tax=Rhododendron molle TaxID=49168 RepID=A0ACC0MCM9_RHOML|nr:hypothetical protein RHMOL_Rhmol09G0125600 [Rhododendron molle]
MGFKSLFRKKKRGGIALSLAGAQSLSGTPTVSRSPSLNSSSLNAQIAEELKLVFKKFDANDDGKISASELASILGSLGYVATPDEISAMIREVDADGDGHIDLDEFIELNTKDVDSDEIMENLREAFSVFDVDGSGSISAEELLNVMRSLGEECSIAECRKMISGVDRDGDGMIDFEEFKVMMVKGSRFDAMERTQSLKIE